MSGMRFLSVMPAEPMYTSRAGRPGRICRRTFAKYGCRRSIMQRPSFSTSKSCCWL